MEYYFFVIIVLIVLKVLFWTFYFYVRAQRMRQVQTQRLIIVRPYPGTTDCNFPYSDRAAIISNAEPVAVSEPVPTCPPPYSEVVKDTSSLPPPYEAAFGVTDSNHTVISSSDSVTAQHLSVDHSFTRNNTQVVSVNSSSSGRDYAT